MRTAQDMASEFLLQILPKRGPKAFEQFIQVLMSCKQQKFIAKELDPELARKYDIIDDPNPAVFVSMSKLLRNALLVQNYSSN